MKYMVAFISQKRSAEVLKTAGTFAKASGAEVVVLKIIPDPQKVGVVAQVFATERPTMKAEEQVQAAASALRDTGITANALVVVDEVAQGIVRAAKDQKIDMLFLGSVRKNEKSIMGDDPIAKYVIEHCPTSVCLIKQADVGNVDD